MQYGSAMSAIMLVIRRYYTFVPPLLLLMTLMKNAAESFTVALTLTPGGVGGTKVQ